MMYATSFLSCLVISCMASWVQGTSEKVIFTKLKSGLTPIPVILDKRFKIDCSVSNKNVKVSLYRKQRNGKKEMVKVDGNEVKRTGDAFELVIRSYFESNDFYCHGEMYGTVYEKEVKAVIIATTQELSPTPEIFPGLSKVNFGDSVKIECKCKGQLSVIKWFKDGESLTSDNEKVKIRNYFNTRTRESTSELTISQIARDDIGIYRCQATSKLQPGYFSFIDSKVETRDADKIYWLANTEKNLLVVQKDTSATLDCSLSNSELHVGFYRLGRFGLPYRVLGQYGKFEYIGKQKLIIRKTSIDDMGMYICKTNGIISKKISLFVSPEPTKTCSIFEPMGLRILCENSKSQFKEYIKGLLKKMAN